MSNEEEGIPPAAPEVAEAATLPPAPTTEESAEADATANKDQPEVDMPQTPTATTGKSAAAKNMTGEKKKRKRSINPAHFRNKKKTKRNFWTQEEVDALLKGVEKIGPGKWTKIKQEYPKIFASRTSLDLKDKWRNIERRPDTNKIAKVAKSKKQQAADAETKAAASSNEGLEPLILTVDCDDGDTEGEKTADNVTAASSATNDLYVWALSKFYPSMSKDDIQSISLLTSEGSLIPYNSTLKKANLTNNARLRVYRKSHETILKEKSVQDV